MNVQDGPGWWVTPVRGGPTFPLAKAPNWFHRLIHKWLAGVTWERGK